MPPNDPERQAEQAGLLSQSRSTPPPSTNDEQQPTASWSDESSLPPHGIEVAGPAQGDLLIDRYLLCDLLGGGGFGIVWKSRDCLLSREVALKVSRYRLGGDDGQLLHEARTVASLGLPGLVTVHDVVRDGECWFVVSELMAGGSLADRLRKNPLSVVDSVQIVARLAEILHSLHLRGYVHRDIKPANILFDQCDQVFLADFGLAVSEKESLTQQGGVHGTVKYMSPEQAQGRPDLVDGRSDQFSLGVVLYVLLTGRQPFVESEAEQYLKQIIERPARPLRDVDDTIPPELEKVCLKMLEKKVGERYATLMDAAHELRDWLLYREIPSKDLPSQRQQQRPPAQRWSTRTSIGLAVLAALLAAVVLGRNYIAQLVVPPDGSVEVVSDHHPSPAPLISPTPPSTSFQALTPEAIVTGKSYPLLEREPKSLFGIKADGYSFDPTRGRFFVEAYGSAAFEMGSTDRPSYTLRIDLKQAARWQGQAGIFFGLHRDSSNAEMLRGQVVFVEAGKNEMRILRKAMLIEPNQFGTNPPLGVNNYAASVPVIPAGRAAELEIRIESGRIEVIQFAGHYLPDLCVTEINSAFGHDHYYGTFGVFAAQVSGVSFENATIRIDE